MDIRRKCDGKLACGKGKKMETEIKDISRACCFTGHRSIPQDIRSAMEEYLENEIERLSEIDFRDFICGGALGFDTLAATCVLRVKHRLPARNICLHLFLPCREQTRGWGNPERSAYDAILRRADSVRYISEEYCAGCMHKRNRAMVDNSGMVISYCTKKSGGTAYTTRYALECGRWVNLIPFTHLTKEDFR